MLLWSFGDGNALKRLIARTSTVRLKVSDFNDNDAFAISFPSVF